MRSVPCSSPTDGLLELNGGQFPSDVLNVLGTVVPIGDGPEDGYYCISGWLAYVELAKLGTPNNRDIPWDAIDGLMTVNGIQKMSIFAGQHGTDMWL